jgi:CheY-like chemotaxis protein
VAEDNSVNQRVAMRFLQRLGYRADVVGNGLEAVEAVRRQPYDVVLMDVQMPQMDGLEATAVIRREHRPGPYIIALTANVLPEDEARCRDAGMQAFLTQPLTLERLEASLAQIPTFEDAASIHRSSDFDPAGLAQVIETFETDGTVELVSAMETSLSSEIDHLQRALAARQSRDASRVLHTWKGHCRLFKAEALAAACETAERLAKDGAFEELERTAPVLIARYRDFLATIVASLPPIDRAGNELAAGHSPTR